MTRQNIVDVLLASPRPGGASAASCANGACGHVYAQTVRTARDAGLRGQVRELRLVGPCHACLRANTGAACPETSTSISNRLLRLPRPDRLVLLGRAVVHGPDGAAVADALDPAPRGRSRDAVLGPDLPGWLAALARLHDLPFERLVVVAGTFRVGPRRPPISCHSSLIGLSNTL